MFILASGSPRRKELLQQINVRFDIRISTAEEFSGDEFAPTELVVKNAAAKAKGVRFGRPQDPLPENFDEIFLQWKNGTVSGEKAATLLGMSPSTFLYKAKRMSQNDLSPQL